MHQNTQPVDRFPAKPYIIEGSPSNITTGVNSTAMFNCPTITDIAAHITWAKYLALNDSDGTAPDTLKLEVFFGLFAMLVVVVVVVLVVMVVVTV